jgi:hypothetical protein
MKRIVLVFAVCVAIIVLTNCQRTGSGSSYSPSSFSSLQLPDIATSKSSSRFDEWQRQKTASDFESRVQMLETQVIGLTNRLRVVEERTLSPVK